MNYYIDTEFIEGTQNKTFLGFNIGKTKPTIDLISIGIVAEDGREYYAISKDFNLREAWNRVQITTHSDEKPTYWIRENVLKPIFEDLLKRETNRNNHLDNGGVSTDATFEMYNMQKLLNIYGKSNSQIAKEIIEFCQGNPVFYAYYAAYDWVAFCQLFGIMMNIPNGFPFYCRDLKQIADNIWETTGKETRFESHEGEHHALNDARINKKNHNFLIDLCK